MMMDSPVVRVVIVTGAWRLTMHRPAWLRRRVRIRGWVSVFFVCLSVSPVVPTFAYKMTPNSSSTFPYCMSKHVGAVEWSNKTVIKCTCWLFINTI
jgi:lysylphosphatidylglycerol synthetase-like protein (DUF2156 family)